MPTTRGKINRECRPRRSQHCMATIQLTPGSSALSTRPQLGLLVRVRIDR